MFSTTNVPNEKCSTGIEQPVSVLLVYLFGWISGLVFFLIEKDNRFVRFCAMQSILLNAALLGAFIPLWILTAIPIIGLIFLFVVLLLGLASTALVVFLIVMGFQGTKVSLPILGKLAEEWSKLQVD